MPASPAFLRRTPTLAVLALLTSLPASLAQQSPSAPLVTFERYHGHRDVKAALDRLAAAYPELVRVASIGVDVRGFDLWMIEITNQKTGPGDEKPALLADGNMNADEPAATEVLLELAQHTVTRYGVDPRITRLLDTTTLYLVPRSRVMRGSTP